MLKLYEVGRHLFWYEEGEQPVGAVEVKKKTEPLNKAKKPANKARKAATK